MMEEKMKKKRVKSLGGLTESSIMSKKHKAIEGVGASSILELKAQLYKTQEKAKKVKDLALDVEFHCAKKKIVPHDVFAQKNFGVEDHAHREVHEVAVEARESSSVIKLQRQAQAAARMDKLRQAASHKTAEEIERSKNTVLRNKNISVAIC